MRALQFLTACRRLVFGSERKLPSVDTTNAGAGEAVDVVPVDTVEDLDVCGIDTDAAAQEAEDEEEAGHQVPATAHDPDPDAVLSALRELLEERDHLRSQVRELEDCAVPPASAETTASASAIASVRRELAEANETIRRLQSEKDSLPHAPTASGIPPTRDVMMVPTVRLRSMEDVPPKTGESAVALCRRRLGLLKDAIMASREETERLERLLQEGTRRLAALGGDASEFQTIISSSQPGNASVAQSPVSGSQPPRRDSCASEESKGDDRASTTGDSFAKTEEMRRLDLEYRRAQALETACRWEDAEKQYFRVLEMQRNLPKRDQVDEIVILRDIGRVLRSQHLYDEAEQFFDKASQLCGERFGDDLRTACALTELATVLREQAKYEEAEVATRECVEVLRKCGGEHDVSTGTALYNLACLQKHQGKYADAEATFKETLETFDRSGEQCEAERADTYFQRGSLYRRMRQFRNAVDDFTFAKELYGKCYGKRDHRAEAADRQARAIAEKPIMMGVPWPPAAHS